MRSPTALDIPSRHALFLSKKIGPRYAGTEGEKLACNYILNWLSELSIPLKAETFKSHRSDIHGLILHGILILVAYLLFPLTTWGSLILAALVFLSLQCETYTWCFISKLLRRSPATNIVAVVRPREKPLRRVILVANYDSAKTSPFFRPKAIRLYHLFYIFTFVSVLMIGMMGILGSGASLVGAERTTLLKIWIGFSPFGIWILIFIILLFFGEVRGKPVMGANDNASGVGVMLSLLKLITSQPLENTEVWGLATSRNTAGARGMVAFLKRHRVETKKSYIINIDHVGRGEIKYLTREGMLIGFRSNRKLSRLIKRMSQDNETMPLRRGTCSIKKSDGLAALTRGRKALTIAGLNGRIPPGWRDSGESYDSLNRMSMDIAASFIYRLLGKMDTTF